MRVELFRARMTGPLALLIGAALFFVGALYAAGIITTLGYEQRHVTFSGFATGTGAGGGRGLKDMVFFEGQTFYANYDVDVREGSFRIAVFRPLSPIGEPQFAERIETSGSGEVTYDIPETGWYAILFEGSVLRARGVADGCDVSYSVWWGVR